MAGVVTGVLPSDNMVTAVCILWLLLESVRADKVNGFDGGGVVSLSSSDDVPSSSLGGVL